MNYAITCDLAICLVPPTFWAIFRQQLLVPIHLFSPDPPLRPRSLCSRGKGGAGKETRLCPGTHDYMHRDRQTDIICFTFCMIVTTVTKDAAISSSYFKQHVPSDTEPQDSLLYQEQE